jgi:hypothetical protein
MCSEPSGAYRAIFLQEVKACFHPEVPRLDRYRRIVAAAGSFTSYDALR